MVMKHPPRPLISASVLAADFMHFEEEIHAVEKAGADYIHIDVMDGRFVPNITFGSQLVSSIRQVTSLPLDVHLMIAPVDPHIESFAEAGASIITIHPEAGPHLHRSLSKIRSFGIKAGVALNPSTPLESIISILPALDLILVMTVNPGFGGQHYIPYMTEKIQSVRSLINQSEYPILLQVDGGITRDIAYDIVNAGADILVAGTAIFRGSAGSYKENIQRLKDQK